MTAARSARRAKARPARSRGGFVDLVLVVVVVGAAWLRTPVGGAFDRLAQLATGDRDALAPLTSFFVTGAPPEIVVLAEQAAFLPTVAPAPGQLPEPWRTAARLALADDLPPRAAQLAATLPDLPEEDQAVALLDRLYEGDPEATLETFAVGEAQRQRAIDRARAAGERAPGSFAAHRAYLPAEDARTADRIVGGTLALATVLDLRWPLDAPHRLTSPFGERMHPTLKRLKFHDGVDLSVPEGTSVLAAQQGHAVSSGQNDVSGQFVILDHGHGVRTSYCHLSGRDLVEGDLVARGQILGQSGNTGRSTGPHLHFSVRVGRDTVDPMRLRVQGAERSGSDAPR
jgi:murein DD-endopeptidase MepM/ murein hydrolase activator NlpD